MFEKIRQLWNDWGFEILVVSILGILLILALYRIGKRGTWGGDVFLPDTRKRRVPQESKGEAECRRVLEKMFDRPFPKARPDILRNPVTGGMFNLELDCYNPELNIAVEYHGPQHYKFIPFFHKNREAFENQKYRDYMKKEMCQKNGILLIEVPYTVKVEKIEEFLKEKLQKK